MSSRRIAITAAVTLVVVAVFGVLVAQQLADEPDRADTSERESIAVRADSHTLDVAKDGAVTLVEFLDFECPSCAAAQPAITQLRKKFAGRITFVVRYFPLDIHPHSREAAHAVEAAARQDAFEQMSDLMFQTQDRWAGSPDPQSGLFRTYADQLGLDLATFDADVASDDVAERVQADVEDGLALGVGGTPSFLLNGEALVVDTLEGLIQQIDDALAG